MARETFVDTSGFYALLVKADPRHAAAAKVLAQARKRKQVFVTSDYVLDETVTLLTARGHRHLVPKLLDATLASAACQIEWMDRDRFLNTAEFATKHLEHGWSFTDCSSFQIMKSRRLRNALTTDVHFQQAGYVPLLR